MAHQLCPACEQISFTLHLEQDCTSLSCNAMQFTTCSLHSEILLHTPSLTELEASASSGCHLCSLFFIGLQSAPRIATKQSGTPFKGVFAVFTCSTVNPWQVSEEVIVISGNIVAAFPVACVPGIRCIDPKYPGNRPSPGLVDARDVIFRTIYQGEEAEGGFFQPGQHYDVFDIKGDFWLVRRAKYDKYRRYWEYTKRWWPGTDFGRYAYPIHADCSCGKGVWELPLIDNFQFGQHRATPEALLPLVQDWVQLCDQAHPRCQLRLTPKFPSLLIEIKDWDRGQLCLVNGNMCGGKYVTLSYRWGDADSNSYVTNRNNVDSRRNRFPLSNLPATVRDAITFSHWLGIKHIWIDAICIIQDCHEDWTQEGGRMNEIYASSYLTISADTSSNTNAGFFPQRNLLGFKTCIHPTILKPWGSRTPGPQYGTFPGHSLGPSKLTGIPVPNSPRGICCGITPAKSLMDTNILSNRGWILQERVLSRRVLHWSKYEVSWECNEIIASERQPAGHGGVEPYRKWLPSNGHETPWKRFRELFYPDPTYSNENGVSRVMKCGDWHDLVREFSRRELSYAKDRLPAMSGLANAFARAVGSPLSNYFFGLWRETLLFDMCWFRSGTDGARIAGVPSFSWASTTADVDFMHPSIIDDLIENIEMVSVDSGTGVAFPSITLRGVIVKAEMLAPKVPVQSFNLEEGLRDSAIWDVSNTTQCDGTVCLCFGMFHRYDYKPLNENFHGLLGVLLNPVPEANNLTFRRVGSYDGLPLDLDLQGLDKNMVTII